MDVLKRITTKIGRATVGLGDGIVLVKVTTATDSETLVIIVVMVDVVADD